MEKTNAKTKMTAQEITDKFCYPIGKKACMYAEQCETETYKTCPHVKRMI